MLATTARVLKYGGAFGSCAAIALCTAYATSSAAQSSKESQPPDGNASPSTASRFRQATGIGS